MVNLFFLALALQTSTKYTSRCSQDVMYNMVDKLVKKHKVNHEYKKTIKETSCCYIVEYWPKDTMMLGGGIKAIIYKDNCEIITYRLYQ
jgi:hypothetical protein